MFLLNFSYGYVYGYDTNEQENDLSIYVFPLFSPSFFMFFHCWIANEICGNADKWRMWGRGVRHPHNPPCDVSKWCQACYLKHRTNHYREWQKSSVSYGTVYRAMCALQLHPHRIRVTHKLSPFDLHFCNWLLTNFTPIPTQPTLLNDFFLMKHCFHCPGM